MLLNFEGFETYATADIGKVWNGSLSTATIVTGVGARNGGSAVRFGWTSYGIKSIPVSSAVIIGFSIYYTGTGAGSPVIVSLVDGATVQMSLSINTSGQLELNRGASTIIATSAETIAASTSAYIELKATVHNSAGTYEVRLNGIPTTLIATGQDLTSTGNNTIEGVAIGPGGLEGGGTGGDASYVSYYDDFYVCNTTGALNNTFLGDIRIEALRPDGDGTYTDFTPSTGVSHFALVDETTPNGTDNNSNATAGNKDSYTMTAVPAIANIAVLAVRAIAAVKKGTSGPRSVKLGVRSNVTNSMSAALGLSTSQFIVSQVFETDPNTSAAWTLAAVDAMQVVVENV